MSERAREKQILARKPHTLLEYHGKTLEEYRVWIRSAMLSFE